MDVAESPFEEENEGFVVVLNPSATGAPAPLGL